jgi:hypothetical protein
MHILVFKTNLEDMGSVHHAGRLLNPMSGIHRWNVDLHDSDNILRIEADPLVTPKLVEDLLQNAGFECEELAD